MSRDDDPPDHQWRERIAELEAELEAACQLYRNDQVEYSTVTTTTQKDLARRVLWYYDALKKYSDEASINVSWSDYNLDQLDELATTQVDVPSQKPGYGGSQTTEPRSAILLVDASRLKQWSDVLFGLSKELGFAAKTATKTAPAEENIVDPRGEERA